MGSPAFFAPELCTDDEALVTPAVDIWAAGLTLFMFVFGQMPFDALSIVCVGSIIHSLQRASLSLFFFSFFFFLSPRGLILFYVFGF